MKSDVKNFYFNTTLDFPDYMHIHFKYMLHKTMEEYNPTNFVVDVYIYVRIIKGMWLVPAQDTPFALILLYVAKTIYLL